MPCLLKTGPSAFDFISLKGGGGGHDVSLGSLIESYILRGI